MSSFRRYHVAHHLAMRITGGRYCGRIVACPPGVIRPAMDRMRESMFTILGNMEGCSFLDLFAGSGIMALEALSRGACRIALVEKDTRKRKTIQNNLNMIGQDYPSGAISLFIRPVERMLKPGMETFDFVHLDPPFAISHKVKLLEMASRAGLPTPDGTITIHAPSEDNFPDQIGRLVCCDRRIYGRSVLLFYRVRAEW